MRDQAFFEKQLDDEIQTLLNLCTVFDKESYNITNVLANRLRVLCHDTKSSVSLLRHANKIDTIYFLDTSEELPTLDEYTILLGYAGLAPLLIHGKGAPMHFAPLDDSNYFKWIAFENWWNGTVIIFNCGESTVTRKELILNVANKDGGSHYDLDINEIYESIAYLGATGLPGPVRHGRLEFESRKLVDFSIRQMAHEILRSLRKEYRKNVVPEDSCWDWTHWSSLTYTEKICELRKRNSKQ